MEKCTQSTFMFLSISNNHTLIIIAKILKSQIKKHFCPIIFHKIQRERDNCLLFVEKKVIRIFLIWTTEWNILTNLGSLKNYFFLWKFWDIFILWRLHFSRTIPYYYLTWYQSFHSDTKNTIFSKLLLRRFGLTNFINSNASLFRIFW